ncbi:MAG: nucleoside deaminase [Mariniphaga sp.]|nr:nucleoside deaminase [Mariniphaga sp.]MDD4227559.1 nucleoside deaminase [Mariniphaga sp.]MDD4424289.1 nucleoside deaminase [Mariniphaga sp.]
MTKKDKYFMQRAIDLAQEGMNQGSGGPFGAVIVKGDKIVAEGYNRVIAENDPTAHAEVEVIRKACKKLNSFQLTGCVIYTSCEPCPMCMAAIYWARLQKVYFACTRKDAADILFDDHFISVEMQKKPADRQIEFSEIMRAEALNVFKKWNDKTDKTHY